MYHYETQIFTNPVDVDKWLNSLDQSAEVVGVSSSNGNIVVIVRTFDNK